jgi:hypothetical protein
MHCFANQRPTIFCVGYCVHDDTSCFGLGACEAGAASAHIAGPCTCTRSCYAYHHQPRFTSLPPANTVLFALDATWLHTAALCYSTAHVKVCHGLPERLAPYLTQPPRRARA